MNFALCLNKAAQTEANLCKLEKIVTNCFCGGCETQWKSKEIRGYQCSFVVFVFYIAQEIHE